MGRIHLDLREIHSIGKHTREWIVDPVSCPLLKRFGITLAGISEAGRDFFFVRHRPAMRQVLVSLEGEGMVWTAAGWQKCAGGKAYVTSEDIAHAYRATARWKVCWVVWAGSRSAERHEPLLRDVDPRPLAAALEGLRLEMSSRQEPEVLQHWVGLVDRYALRVGRHGAASLLWPLWEEVRRTVGERWTLLRLAERAGLEPEQLRRICHRETGCSPVRQVTVLRMQEAVSFLGMGYTVEATAQAVGYENCFAFSTAFRRVMGEPPSRVAARLRR